MLKRYINYLVVKDINGTSSKIEKAKKINCKIITLEEIKNELRI